MNRWLTTLALVPVVGLTASLVSVLNQRLLCLAAGYTPDPGTMVGIAALVSCIAVVAWCGVRHGADD